MKEVETEQRHEEERNLSVHDEQMHEETGPKTSGSRKLKSRLPAYSALSSGEKKCHTGPCSGLIPIKMLKEGCSIWKIK